ncbi:MAG TPA: DUF1559 domain-containing protein [Pirellulales bacterium]|nr:DUF1559 domain-containing protein [Pirellulales bacterium]
MGYLNGLLPFRSSPRRDRNAAALHELLIVIAIIGILIALLLPALNTTREAARRSQCSANEKQIALSVKTYEEQHRRYPNSAFMPNDELLKAKLSEVVPASAKDDKTQAPYSMFVAMLPYMEQAHLYDVIDFEKRAFDPANSKQAKNILPGLRCPSYTGPPQSAAKEYVATPSALAQYKGVGAPTFAILNDAEEIKNPKGDGGVLQPYAIVRSIPATSLTIMICETAEQEYAAWYDGTTASISGFHPDIDKKKKATTPALNYQSREHPVFLPRASFGGAGDMAWGPSSDHPGVTIHAFCDGSTRSIVNDIDAGTYKALITRNSADNEDIDRNEF